jgi:hypothetical protein
MRCWELRRQQADEAYQISVSTHLLHVILSLTARPSVRTPRLQDSYVSARLVSLYLLPCKHRLMAGFGWLFHLLGSGKRGRVARNTLQDSTNQEKALNCGRVVNIYGALL